MPKPTLQQRKCPERNTGAVGEQSRALGRGVRGQGCLGRGNGACKGSEAENCILGFKEHELHKNIRT